MKFQFLVLSHQSTMKNVDKILLIFLITINLNYISSIPVEGSPESTSGEEVSLTLTNKNHKQVLSQNRYVFVKFYTDW